MERRSDFVFLPQDLNNVANIDLSKLGASLHFKIDKAKEQYDTNELEAAIKSYDDAMKIVLDLPRKIVLSACYLGRANCYMRQQNYNPAISNSTMAIELNEHNFEAYITRSKCYFAIDQLYRALEDITQACVIERFKNPSSARMAADIIAKINQFHYPRDQWSQAYTQTGADKLICDHCLKNELAFAKDCGLFDGISVQVPPGAQIDQPLSGYLRAMVGIKELKIFVIKTGCDQEIASKGEYLVHSYILKAYMDCVVDRSTIQTNAKHIKQMTRIILRKDVPNVMKDQAKLCRASLYFCKNGNNFGSNDLFNLEPKYGNTGLFNVIKSGVLFHEVLRHSRFLKHLEKCAKMLPNALELQLRLVESQFINTRQPISVLIQFLEKLVVRFPKELSPRIRLMKFCIRGGFLPKAKEILQQTAIDFPSRSKEFISFYGFVNPKSPTCVDYFKQSIEAQKDDPDSVDALIHYFTHVTNQPEKAIEVCTKALSNYLQKEHFEIFWNVRQNILKDVILRKAFE